MFKKKPQVKNLSPLRSSDRRKLADQIISEFAVRVDELVDVKEEVRQDALPSGTKPLSSVRNALVPENCSSARFTTHAGSDNKLVSGTIYVGTHPGHEERILWIQYGVNTPRLYPTVYTLWENPDLVPLLHTPGIVVQKLKTGADLMTPGLWGGPPWPHGAKKNAIIAVASAERPSVPVWLGVCEIDVSGLGNVQGVKGKAVDGIHWAGDEIWSWTSSSAVAGGRDAPEALQGWGDELADDKLADIADLEIEDQEEAEEDGGVSLEHAADRNAHATGADNSIDDASHEPTTKEIDEAFQEAFIYALFDAKKTGSPPNYSLDLPIQPSFLIANMIQPHLRSQNQHYTIKKTSWKNVKKFIKHLDKQQLVKSKDRNGGETVILDVDFEDRQITQFTPYALPKTRGDESGDGPAANGNADSSLSQDFTLQYLYRASSKLVPDLIPSKTDYYTRAQISDYIRTYVENNPDLNDGVSSKRFIKLNPFIANNILSRTKSDNQILVNGEIARDALQKQILDDTHLCMPFWVLLKADQKWDPESPDRTIPKPKAGSPPKVTITIEKRTGTKTVTRVTGLETFNVSPQTMAPELQKRCASSASVEQAVGGKPGMMEVMVQGDQRDIVIREVGKRGVKKEWFEVIDKTKKKAK